MNTFTIDRRGSKQRFIFSKHNTRGRLSCLTLNTNFITVLGQVRKIGSVVSTP